MTNKITIILAAATALLLSSCEKDKPYAHPYDNNIQAEAAANATTSTETSQATVVRTYIICLSSKELSENLIVDYSFNVGDGLKAGIDFERVTTGNQIVFVPGVYSMPIRIRWLPNEIDPLKDNTITIRIENTSLGFTVGFPGPDQLSRQHTIRKINM